MQGRTGAIKLGSRMDLVESAHREVRSEHRRDYSGVVLPGAIDPVEKGAVSPCRELCRICCRAAPQVPSGAAEQLMRDSACGHVKPDVRQEQAVECVQARADETGCVIGGHACEGLLERVVPLP